MDTEQTILTSAKRFLSGTLLSRVSGFVREMLMAALFGTSAAIAAFWMAFRFAHLLRRLFGEGALHSAFIPHFEALRTQNPQKAARFFYDLSTGVTSILLLLIIVTEGVLGSLLYFGSLTSGNRQVIELTMLLLPAIVFISLYALNTAFLNCERSYFLPSVAPLFLNLVWIAAICFLWRMPPADAMRYLAMLLVFAFVIQWLVTLPRVLQLLCFEYQRKPLWKEIGALLRPFSLGILGVCATQLNSALDAIFARIADPEGPAYLWYALRLQQLPLALFGVGMAGALLPPLTRAIQAKEEGNSHRFFSLATREVIELMLPITVAIFVLGLPAVNLIYGHGHFSQAATFQVTHCLWAYGAGLIPMSLVLIFATTFYARKNYLTPTVVSLLSVALNVALNSLFVFVLHWGAVSIAIATTISALFNATALYVLQKERVKEWGGVLKLAGITAIAAGFTTALFREPDELPRQIIKQLTLFGCKAALLGITLCGLALILKVPLNFGVIRTRKRQAH